MRNRKKELSPQHFALLLSLPVIVFMVMIVAYPFGYAFWLSFREVSLFGGFSTEYVGIENYVDIAGNASFQRALGISLRFTAFSVVFAILIGLGLALIMNRLDRGRALFGTLIILPWSVSLYGTGIMWQYLVRGQTGFSSSIVNFVLGNTDSQTAIEISLLRKEWIVELIALANAWNLAPLVAFFVFASLKTIPRRLYDLARIDKLSAWQTFRNVTLPPLQYTLFVFASIVLILSIKLLDLIFVVAQGGPGGSSTTLSYLIYELAFRRTSYGYSAAMSFYLLVLTIFLALSLYFLWGRRLDDKS